MENEVGKIKDLEICQIPFSTLIKPKSIFTKRLNTLSFPCNVENQIACSCVVTEILSLSEVKQ